MNLGSPTEIALALHRIGAVRFGDFTLKDGRKSPFYVDLRLIIGYPEVLKLVANAMLSCVEEVSYDCLAGIPYAGLPLAVAMSLEGGRPLIYPRKEAKSYGTKKVVEGVFRAGDRALVVDDVITSGGAKFEAIAPLREAGLVVEDVVVVVDREQGGAEALESKGLRVHSVLPVRTLLRTLHSAELLSAPDYRRALDFVEV